MRFPRPLPVCVLLVLTPFTAMRARAQTQAQPGAGSLDLSAATQQLATLCRELGATDAMTTLEVWSDAAAAKGMDASTLGNLRGLFNLQLAFGVLGVRDKYRGRIRYNAAAVAFEGDGSDKLNAFLNALRNGVRTGPMGPLSDAQRASLVSSAGAALNNADPIAPYTPDGVEPGADDNSGYTMEQKLVANYAVMLVDAALPGNASPAGLPSPHPPMNTFGLQEVRKFKSAIGADMGLYDDEVALNTELPAGVAVNLPVSQANNLTWRETAVYEQRNKEPITQKLIQLNAQSDSDAIARDIRQSNGNLDSPALQAVRNLIRLSDIGEQNYNYVLQNDLQGFRQQVGNDDVAGIAQRVEQDENHVLHMQESVVAASASAN